MRSYSSSYYFCCGLFFAWRVRGLSSRAASAGLCLPHLPRQRNWLYWFYVGSAEHRWCCSLFDARYCSNGLSHFGVVGQQEACYFVSCWESKNSSRHSFVFGWHLASCNRLDVALSAEIALVDCSGLLVGCFAEERCSGTLHLRLPMRRLWIRGSSEFFKPGFMGSSCY